MRAAPVYSQVHKLALLRTVVDCGSFREACRRTRLTQSALSQTVSQLEAFFAQTLVVRDRGTVRPTEVGAVLLASLAPILAALDALVASQEAPVPKLTSLDFGTYESLAVTVLPLLVRRLTAQLPGLKLSLRTGRSAELTSRVRKGELCMALVIENDRMNGLVSERIASDHLGLFVAKSRGSAAEPLANGYATIGFGAAGPPRYYQRLLRALGPIGQPTLICDSFETVGAVTAKGGVAGILPFRVAQRSPELTPAAELAVNPSVHGIFLVSRKSCDVEESRFLAAQLRQVLGAGTAFS